MQKVSDQAKLAFEEAFLHHKPVKMLVSLTRDDVKYATQVSKHVDCTYSHTVKVLDVFKKLGLVEFEKKGRVKMVRLTGDGEELAHDFEGIRKKFSRFASNFKEFPTGKEAKGAKAK
ncbi:MAG TPA: hypothetical protein VI933_00535 [archaeon]|nr:hypothetical protein [archaeon]